MSDLEKNSSSSGSGALFDIGTILRTPTAPTGNGTWLACDGTSQLQSTYATLFSDIGHQYLKYSAALTAGGTTATTLIPFSITPMYLGSSTWIIPHQSDTRYEYSTDGGNTWSFTASNNGLTFNSTATIATNGTGTVVIINPSSTTYTYSTDRGATWNVGTFPASVTAPSIIWNGTRFGVISTANTNFYTSTDGISWTTNTGVRPSSSKLGNLYWFNNTWIYAESLGNMVSTTTADGSAGWTRTQIYLLGINPVPSSTSYSPTVLVSADGGNVIYTTNLTTINESVEFPSRGFNDPTNSKSTVWNGLHFISLNSGAGLNISITDLKTSLDGNQWYTKPLTNVNYGLSLFGTNASGANIYIADTTNFVTIGFYFANSNSAVANYLVRMSPSINTSTNFNLPDVPGSFIRVL